MVLPIIRRNISPIPIGRTPDYITLLKDGHKDKHHGLK